jgi:hypothetical protein
MEGIDLRGLPEEQVRLIQEIVEYLKKKAKSQHKMGKGCPMPRGKLMTRSWPLGVKGRLTREEIYEHL